MSSETEIQGLMQTAMSSLKQIVDVNTIVGEKIDGGNGVSVVPVSRVSCGFVAGGGEYGSMGGDGQPQTVAALTTRVADFNLSPQEAVTAPRWLLGRSWGAPDNDLKLEGRISSSIAEDLRRRGHVVRMLDNFTEVMGHAGAIRCHANGILQGAADPRSDGQALAF